MKANDLPARHENKLYKSEHYIITSTNALIIEEEESKESPQQSIRIPSFGNDQGPGAPNEEVDAAPTLTKAKSTNVFGDFNPGFIGLVKNDHFRNSFDDGEPQVQEFLETKQLLRKSAFKRIKS